MKIWSFISLLIFSQSVFALSELTYQIDFQKKVAPLLETMKEGFFQGEKNIPIHFRTLIQKNARNCVVVLPGRTEPIEKYAELVYDLLHSPIGRDLNFYLMDHRGQGLSGRLTGISDKGDVDHFESYIADIDTFIHNQKLSEACDQKFLLAHSMGAGIGVAYMQKFPHVFDKAALSSPMLKILTKPYPYLVARAIVEAEILAGHAENFAIGQKGFNEHQTFEKNTFTTSPVRFDMTIATFNKFPKAKVGGVTNRWLHETMNATAPIRSSYEDIKTPLRVFRAGIETYASTDEMIRLCQLARECKDLSLPTSKHEVFMDRDVNRNQVLNELISFFR